ncbi:matrixin family metalloprotease [Nitriliruptor alkaliphilus]|uniref:matrixin family metalloprotease n=1 Tax=Nitriliruptor alkaliphilus TaxID=427918 RepID=UPI0006961B64|nr:matrixin family metalloprotease [Nitriliruptor alkaliphilus]
MVAALVVGAGVAIALLVAVRGGTPADTPEVAVGASDEGFTVWARNADGTPVRWDPCSPIEIVVSDIGSPLGYGGPAFTADVEAAVATLREATGLELSVTGTTDEVPDAARSTVTADTDGARRWAPVLIGWRPPGDGGLPLRDVDRGVAVPIAVGPADARVYVTAQVVLNPEREDLQPGAADRATSWGATILHELAHVLGLGHVDDPDELMHTYPGAGPVRFGPGDLAGLEAVGAGGGCLEVPTPQDLDVVLPDEHTSSR